MSDYAGNGGTTGGNDQTYDAGNGQDAPITIPGSNPPVTPASLVKGQSVTILIGEKCLNRDLLWDARADDDCGFTSGWDPDVFRWGYCPPMPDYSAANEALYQSGAIWTEYYDSFGSAHENSSNYALCDGSVRPINYNVNPNVFFYLCSRNIKLTTQPNLPPIAPGAF